VQPSTQPGTANRNLYLQWPSDDDNGQTVSLIQAWKSSNGQPPYAKYQDPQNATGSGGVRAAWFYNLPSFSFFTFADGQNPLPLGLLRFAGSNVKGNAQLSWTLTNEKNWKQFIVERSADGKNFGAIGQVSALSNGRSSNNYSYADRLVQNSYYRLRLIGDDGKTEYSQTIYLTTDAATLRAVSLFPNPAAAGAEIAVDGSTDLQENTRIDVVGLDGRLVFSQEGTLQNVNTTLQSRIADMPAGVYQVRVTLTDTQTTLKFIKQ
jgi:hypothetical protein